MKKLLILCLNLVLLCTFISCNKSVYKDGLFIGKGDTYSKGYDDITISIDEGKIVDVTLRHFNENHKEINYSEWTGEKVNGIINPNLQKYRSETIKEVLENQSGDITIINDISEISSNWKLALNRALQKAKK